MNETVITITGKDIGAARAFQQVRAEADALKRTAHETSSALGGIGRAVGGIASQAAGVASGIALFGGLSKGIDAAKGAIIGFNSQMQNAQVGFSSLLGSGEAATKMLGELQAFARTTPFEFPELVASSQKLLAFGFAAKDIIPIMTAVGDATAAMGNVSGAALDKITLAIGQIGTKGKASTEELLQLTESGIPAFRILADGLGVTTGRLQKMVEDGLVPADRAIKILLEGMEARAPGAMDKMSRTWTGAVSNIKDSLNQLVGGAFKPFFESLTEGANRFANFLGTERVKQFGDTVGQALANLNRGIGALFSGREADADRYFGNFVAQATAASKEVQLALLRIADAFAPAVAPVVELFTNLTQAAVSWGANLISSFASGMVSAAASILTSVLTDIFNYIAGWFPHSPAKHGPFKDIYLFGADLLESLFEGMSRADFSALDRVMGGVEDALGRQLAMGDFGEEGLIPRMVGSEAGVARALADMREFGAISDETFGILSEHLGEAAPRIFDLLNGVAQLAEKDRAIAGLTREIDDLDTQLAGLERQLNAVNRAFADQKRPIEDAIEAQERYYGGLMRNIDATIRKLQDQLRAMEATQDPLRQALDAEERQLNLNEANRRLSEVQNQHLTRRAQLEADVAAAQHALSRLGPNADAYTVQQAQTRLAEAQNRLAREGQQTDADRLAINRARRDVAQAQLDIETAGTRQELENAQNERDRIERQRNEAIDPLKLQLEDVNDLHRDAVRLLEEQMRPLEDQRQALEDQRRILEEERKPLEDAVSLAEDRLSHERDIAEQYRDQLDLLERIAKAASAGGAGGGAGRVGGGAGGLGAPNVNLANLGLNLPRPPSLFDPQESPVGGDPIGAMSPNIDETLKNLKEKVKKEFRAAVKEGFEEGIKDVDKTDAVWMGIGGIIGAKFGGKFGAAFGAATGKAISDYLTGPLANKLDELATDVFGPSRFGETWGERLKTALGRIFSAERWKEFGGFIVQGLWDGAQEVWDRFIDYLQGMWDGFIKQFKGTFGIDSPSRVFKQFGDDIVQGLWDGITSRWDAFKTWLGKRFDDAVAWVKDKLGISSPSTVFHGIGVDVMAGLWNGVTEKWTEVKKWFTELPGNIVEAVGDVTSTLKEKGRNLISGLFDGIKSKWSDASDGPLIWLSKLGGEAFKAVGDLTRSLWSKGSDLMNGFWDGLKAKWSEIATWLANRATEAASFLDPRNLPGIPGGSRKTLGPEEIKGGSDVVKGSGEVVKGGSAGVAPSGTWEPGPNGTQVLWTSPQTYWLRYPDGRVEQHTTLDPNHPLRAAGAPSGAGLGAGTPAGGGGGGYRAPFATTVGGGGTSISTTRNAGGITNLFQEIVQDEFGTFMSYSWNGILEKLLGPLDDLMRRFGTDLSGMPQALKDAINAMVLEHEASRNPASPNYDPMSDPVAAILAEVGVQAFQPAAQQLQAAAASLEKAAEKLQEEGPTAGISDKAEEEARRKREEEEKKKQQEGRATGGPIGADGSYYLHAGEWVNPAGSGGSGSAGGGSVQQMAAAIAMALSGMSIQVDGRTLGQVVSHEQGRLAAYAGAL